MTEQTICFTEREAVAILRALWDAHDEAEETDNLSAAAHYFALIELLESRIDEQRPKT